jgi:low temperature requirement protein LtrA
LELFYDLVYVVIIAELSHALAEHITWGSLGGFAFLFVIVWWAWFNGTSYHDLHGQNDIRTRVLTFLQMISVVAMAVFAHDALGESSAGFALSYAAFQLILTYMWWRTGVHDENHRPLSRPYSAAFLFTTLLFVLSVFFSAPVRFYLWGIAILISLLLPGYTISLGKRDPAAQAEIDIVMNTTHSLVERFGLFNIIVLGEIIVGVVAGLTGHHHLTWSVGLTGALGTLLAIGIWWVYFDSVSHRLPRVGTLPVSMWFYLHLPLTMGITVVGASVLNIIENAGDHLPAVAQLLLSGSLAIVLLSIAALVQTIQPFEEDKLMHRVGSRALLISAPLIIVLGFVDLNTSAMLLLQLLLILVPILFGLVAWLQTRENQTM